MPQFATTLLRTPNDWTLTIARLVLFAIFFAHGTQKMFGWFGGPGYPAILDIFQSTMGIPPPLTILAMVTEVGSALLLLFGLAGRLAALGLLVVMIVAPFANGLYPQFFMNWQGNFPHEGYEYHLLAIALLLGILVRGSGALSLDRVLQSYGPPAPASQDRWA